MSFTECFLGDVVDLNYGKGLSEDKRSNGDVNVYGSGGIIGTHNEALVEGPGIIIGRKGNVGSVYYERNNFFPIDTVYYVSKKREDDDLRFLYYWLFTLPLDRMNSDAAVPGLNREAAYRVKTKIPDPPSQKKIANTLSAYDDLIENNIRRISLLEKSAQLLFKEWFVRLKFPGYEHTKFVNGIPEGWIKKPISEFCESINYGFTASAVDENIGPKYLRITDIVPPLIDWSGVPYCEINESKKENFKLIEGDIVIARTGATVGYAKRINKKHPETVFASYLVRFRIKEDYSNKIIGILVESNFYKNFVRSQVGGAAQPNANAKILSSLEFIHPDTSIKVQFDTLVTPIMDQIEQLNILNDRLIKVRELLLPKLMNGELSV